MEPNTPKPSVTTGGTQPPADSPAPTSQGTSAPASSLGGVSKSATSGGTGGVIKATDEKNIGWKTHDFNKSAQGESITPKRRRWYQDKRIVAGIGMVSVVAIATGSVLFIKKPVRTASAADHSIDLQGLSNNLLNGLNNAAAGSNQQQTLNIAANTDFKNSATVEKKLTTKDSIDALGTIEAQNDINGFKDLNLSGNANLNTLSLRSNFAVAGTSTLQGNINAKGQLAVSGPLNVTGPLTAAGNANVGGNLSVAGGISAGGPITGTNLTVTNVTYTGTLTLAGHLASSGANLSAVTDVAAGSGATVHVAGNDTSGTVIINTGSGPVSGIMARINFARSYGTVPKVLITPVGGQSAQIQYYVSKSSNYFTIETNTAPQATKTYAYDYFIVE